MARFKGLLLDTDPKESAVPEPVSEAPVAAGRRVAKGRAGKKGILGHFSPELSRALNMIALEEDTTMQAIMGEAFDLLLRSRGKHPFGER